MTVIAITAVALLQGFTTSISSSAEYRGLASIDTVLKSFVETATYQLGRQQQPLVFVACAAPSTYSSLPQPQEPRGYTASISAVEYWESSTSAWGTACNSNSTPPQAELLTATATGNGVSESLQFAVTDPAYASPVPAFTSVNSVNEVTGTQFNFPVTATGGPTPTLSASGQPPGVTFVDNGGGNGVLSGTNAVAAGTYNITFTATNGAGTTTQSFKLVVNALPAFTSANSDTVPPGATSPFAVTATGTPTPSLSVSGQPSGVTFVDNGGGNGKLTIGSGVASGTYNFTLTATNAAGATGQPFTLVVSSASIPTFTSAASLTVPYNATQNFTVQTTGAPTPSLSSSTLMSGVSFTDNGDGTATLRVANSVTPSTYNFTFTATNSAGTANQAFQLTVNSKSAPTITSPTVANPENPGHNGTGTFVLTGTGFMNGLTVTGQGSATVNSYTYLSSSQLQVTVTGQGGSRAPGSFTVTNPDGGTVSSPSGSFVNG
jgi:hypothetical protein